MTATVTRCSHEPSPLHLWCTSEDPCGWDRGFSYLPEFPSFLRLYEFHQTSSSSSRGPASKVPRLWFPNDAWASTHGPPGPCIITIIRYQGGTTVVPRSWYLLAQLVKVTRGDGYYSLLTTAAAVAKKRCLNRGCLY